MGKAATDILLAAIEDNNKLTQLHIQPLLVIRGSSTMTRLAKKVIVEPVPIVHIETVEKQKAELVLAVG